MPRYTEQQEGACTLWCSGVTEAGPDPSPAACASVLQGPEGGRGQLRRIYLGRLEPDAAEYAAVRLGLAFAVKQGFSRVIIHSTSRIVVETLSKPRPPVIGVRLPGDRIRGLLQEHFDYHEIHLQDNPRSGVRLKAKKELGESLAGWFGLWADGSAPDNGTGTPGPTGAGAVLRSPQGGMLAQESWPLGEGTNNEAEYLALAYGLDLARQWGARFIEIRSDSMLVVKQVIGDWQVREPRLLPLREMIRALLKGFSGYRLKWIPREQNRRADSLAQQGSSRSREQAQSSPALAEAGV